VRIAKIRVLSGYGFFAQRDFAEQNPHGKKCAQKILFPEFFHTLTKALPAAKLVKLMYRVLANNLYKLVNSPVFLSALFSWFFAQLIKTLVEMCRRRSSSSWDILASLVWRTGGMPSSHSALVASLATSLGFTEGLDSPIFVVALFYGILTIRDAMGVRRAAGNQAQALNQLADELRQRLDVRVKPVKEVQGHTPSEVFIGCLLGFFIAMGFCIL
jgi:acid phosphatase family membrane protein YuiD